MRHNNLTELEVNKQRQSFINYIPTCSTSFVLSAFILMDNVEKHPSIDRQIIVHIDALYGLRLSKTRLNLIRLSDLKIVASEPRSDYKSIANLQAKYLKIKIDEWNSKEE